MGILRADLIRSRRRLRWAGLTQIGSESDYPYVYADSRETPQRKSGWVDVGLVRRIDARHPGFLRLEFHPFRIYTLTQLARVFEIFQTPPAQYIYCSEQIRKQTDRNVSLLRLGTRKEQFAESLGRWHDINDLSILVEPISATGITERAGGLHEEQIRLHRERIKPVLRGIGQERLEELRQDLCCAAELLDRNKNLHVLVRLTQGRWQKLKGPLGAAMYLLAMAESLRRATEGEFSVLLPEEDEMGFGQYPEELKRELYGGRRILNGKRSVQAAFVRNEGLDFGTRVRCYVEGATELGALETVFDENTAVELVDMRGVFGKKGAQAGGLREHLARDMRESVFSFLFFDGDREDSLRIARRAAEQDAFVGEFYVAKPDFELENFSAEELFSLVRNRATEMGLATHELDRATSRVPEIRSSEELVRIVAGVNGRLADEIKGSDWGRRLMELALEREALDGRRRPVLDQISRVRSGLTVDFKLTLDTRKVDPLTGRLVPV